MKFHAYSYFSNNRPRKVFSIFKWNFQSFLGWRNCSWQERRATILHWRVLGQLHKYCTGDGQANGGKGPKCDSNRGNKADLDSQSTLVCYSPSPVFLILIIFFFDVGAILPNTFSPNWQSKWTNWKNLWHRRILDGDRTNGWWRTENGMRQIGGRTNWKRSKEKHEGKRKQRRRGPWIAVREGPKGGKNRRVMLEKKYLLLFKISNQTNTAPAGSEKCRTWIRGQWSMWSEGTSTGGANKSRTGPDARTYSKFAIVMKLFI